MWSLHKCLSGKDQFAPSPSRKPAGLHGSRPHHGKPSSGVETFPDRHDQSGVVQAGWVVHANEFASYICVGIIRISAGSTARMEPGASDDSVAKEVISSDLEK